MGNIVDLNGQTLIGTNSNKGKLTQAQAGAVVVSEIDMAIEKWNIAATQMVADDAHRANLFRIEFTQNKYAPEPAEKTGLFGYAELSIVHKHLGKETKIYTKGQNFKKESELNNTNAYYPALVFDCIGFLIASGLMYNLALVAEQNGTTEENKTEPLQSGNNIKGKPGTGSSRKRSTGRK